MAFHCNFINLAPFLPNSPKRRLEEFYTTNFVEGVEEHRCIVGNGVYPIAHNLIVGLFDWNFVDVLHRFPHSSKCSILHREICKFASTEGYTEICALMNRF